jgi:hypothetical protein
VELDRIFHTAAAVEVQQVLATPQKNVLTIVNSFRIFRGGIDGKGCGAPA